MRVRVMSLFDKEVVLVVTMFTSEKDDNIIRLLAAEEVSPCSFAMDSDPQSFPSHPGRHLCLKIDAGAIHELEKNSTSLLLDHWSSKVNVSH